MLQRWWDGLRQRLLGHGSRDGRDSAVSAPRDYRTEREDARHAHMSEEDRAWEAASRQRDRDRQTRPDTPANPEQTPERQDH